MHTRRYTIFAVALVGLACLLLAAASTAQALTAKQKVGKSLFFDANLSEPAGHRQAEGRQVPVLRHHSLRADRSGLRCLPRA